MNATEIVLICIGIIVGLFLIWVLLGLIAYFSSLTRGGIIGRIINKKFMKEIEIYKIDYSWWDNVLSKKIEIKTKNETLVGIILPVLNSKKVGICVHGYYGNYKDVNPWAKIFYDNGFNVIAPSLRAHGDSSGQNISMGYYDKDDIALWIEKAIELFGKDCEIVLFGESMGAATVLLASELNLPSNVKCVISDSAYSNAYEELKYCIEKTGHLPSFLFLPVANFFSKIINKCDLKKVSPIISVKKTSLPILFIHGLKDGFVPAYMSKSMYEISNKNLCSLYLTEDAIHIQSYAINPENYKDIFISFVGKWTS